MVIHQSLQQFGAKRDGRILDCGPHMRRDIILLGLRYLPHYERLHSYDLIFYGNALLLYVA